MGVNWQAVRAALDTDLKNFGDANKPSFAPYSGATAMDIAFENMKYEPTAGRAWCEATLLPNVVEQEEIGQASKEFASGLYQVRLFFPRDEGTADAAERADLIRAHYTRGMSLTSGGQSITVRSKPSLTTQVNETWFVVVLTIPFFIYA